MGLVEVGEVDWEISGAWMEISLRGWKLVGVDGISGCGWKLVGVDGN